MRDIMEKIHEIEKNEADVLSEFIFDDFWLWTSIRIHLWSMITPDLCERVSAKRGRPIVIRLGNFLKMILNLKEFIKLMFMRKSDVLIFTYKQYRRDFIDGYHRDVYFSYLIEYLESRGIKYSIVSEDEDTFYKLKIRERKQIIFRQPFLFLSKLLSVFVNVKKRIPERHMQIAQELENKYKLPVVKALFAAFNAYFTKLRINKCFIDKISPKFVFMVPSINKEAMISICKKRGIITIEGEHGTYVPILHCYPENLKEIAKKQNLTTQAPDYYLSFGKNTHDELVKASLIDPANVRAVGNTRIDYFIKRNRERIQTSDKINVLMTSQFTVTDDLIEFFKGVNQYLETRGINNIQIKVKLHFDEFHRLDDWKKVESAYIKIFDENAEKSLHLFDMILESDFLASVYSTTLSEAISLGCPTIIIQKWGWDAYKDYVDKGIALPVDTPKVFIDTILEYKADKDKHAKLQNKMKEFNALMNTPNAIENYLSFFDEMYKK
ncbi:MAG: hypothetical protein K8S87_12435 [Planctomycetes bacterium]|nr:hypothetical protein [Planctomycetota bacterium]